MQRMASTAKASEPIEDCMTMDEMPLNHEQTITIAREKFVGKSKSVKLNLGCSVAGGSDDVSFGRRKNLGPRV